jgi:hypothetical protein
MTVCVITRSPRLTDGVARRVYCVPVASFRCRWPTPRATVVGEVPWTLS